MSCLFCRIATGELSAKIYLENKHIVAFDDITPQAPVHILIIPKLHIKTINDLSEETFFLMGELGRSAKHLAAELGVSETGYRLVMNCQAGAGQSVFHLHMHLLAGRAFTWPPG